MPDSTPQFSPGSVIPGFSLAGKKVFVTGASRGIGRACALTLAAAGADVALGSSAAGADSAANVCHEIQRMGRRAEAFPFDVRVPRDVETTCARRRVSFEGIDILVNNAGSRAATSSFQQDGPKTWDSG